MFACSMHTSQSTTSGTPKNPRRHGGKNGHQVPWILPKASAGEEGDLLSSKDEFGSNEIWHHLTEKKMVVVKEKKWSEMTKTWGWWKYYHSEWNTLFFCSERMCMICGCCFLWWILSTLRIRYASWRCSKVTGHFFPQERNLHLTRSTQKKHALSSGYVRGVARRRCSDHWYSGDWDQVEGCPVSILLMALH